MTRQRLDNRRPGERIAFDYKGKTYTTMVGFRLVESADGTHVVAELGDVFVDAGKVGSDVEAAARTGGLLISLGLQEGIPLKAFQLSLPRLDDGGPADVIGAAIDAIISTYGDA